MSSKYEVRNISGIRESAQSLVRALEKIENPPIKPIPSILKKSDNPKDQLMICPKVDNCPDNTCPHRIKHESMSNSCESAGHCGQVCIPVPYVEAFWQPHKASKVIECGFFCPKCGQQVHTLKLYLKDETINMNFPHHLCTRDYTVQ